MESGAGFNSSSSGSTDHSVNGLKFGKKIYFEDVGGGAQGKKSVVDGGSPSKKGRSGGVQGGQPARCQVEGCQVDLSDAKTYYAKHKVCGLHSKTSMVIVGGLEQRFCQQCSRFHLLPEFDQGKRSCRRRLAGHNERRRKPPTASTILPPRYGSLSSSFLDNSSNSSTSRGGGFLVDFSAYPNLSGGASWPNAPRNQNSGSGNSLQQGWQDSDSPPSELVLHSSSPRTAIPSRGIPSGDSFPGVSDSSHAHSLLSNQPWGSRTRSSTLGVTSLLNPDGTTLVQPFGIHDAPMSHFSSPWGFKGDDVGSACNELPSNMSLGPMSHDPPKYDNLGELEVPQQSNRPQYLDVDHSRGYDSSLQNTNWSL